MNEPSVGNNQNWETIDKISKLVWLTHLLTLKGIPDSFIVFSAPWIFIPVRIEKQFIKADNLYLNN